MQNQVYKMQKKHNSKFVIHSSKTATVSPEVLVHIAALVERDNIGLPQRCARYHHRAAIRRTAMAACIFVGICIAYSSTIADPLYDQITTSSKTGNQHICDIIRVSIENIS